MIMEEPCKVCTGRIQAMAIVNRIVPLYCGICKNRNEEEVKNLVETEKSLSQNENKAQ